MMTRLRVNLLIYRSLRDGKLKSFFEVRPVFEKFQVENGLEFTMCSDSGMQQIFRLWKVFSLSHKKGYKKSLR